MLINKHNHRIINFLFWIVLLTITVFPGCKKELGEYMLNDLKNQNLLTGYETLIFLTNNNDSVVFTGEGRHSNIIHTSSSSRDEYYINERDLCSFKERDYKYELIIDLQTHLSNISEMYLYFVEILDSNNTTCTDWTKFNKLPLNQLPWHARYYIDSLNILDKCYYDVYVDSSLFIGGTNSYNCSSLNRANRLFYTTTHGIIKIDFKDGTTWRLKEIAPTQAVRDKTKSF